MMPKARPTDADVSTPCRSLPPHAALLHVDGEDAAGFLQGQLSHDMRAINAERAAPTSLSSPKGRVIATGICLALPSGGFGLLLAPDIAAAVQRRLQMYVLRSRVTLALAASGSVGGLVGGGTELDIALPDRAWACLPHDHGVLVRAPGAPARWWIIGPSPAAGLTESATAFAAGDIACGWPCIGQAQTEQHVAQHLGLQSLGALSFDKGCYTGQEVIARIHYRGGVNRIPIRLQGPSPAPEAGTVLTDADGKPTGDVVNAVAVGDGCEVLAVFRGPEAGQTLYLDGRAFQQQPFLAGA